MNKRSLMLFTIMLALFAFFACEGNKPAASKEAAPAASKAPEAPTFYTGREAFQRMYAAAHLWAPDARPYRLQSEVTNESTGQDGKSAIWRAGFASPSRRTIKAFLWSGSHAEGAPSAGVSSGTEDTYSPSNSSTLVFDPSFLKTDSDKAFEAAQPHGGEKITKANPKQVVNYLLEWNPAENMLIWHVIYGPSRSEAKLSVSVNASTGAYLRVDK